MHVCRTIDDIRRTVAGFRAAGAAIALVQTAGTLHAGHRALLARAKAEDQRVIVAIPASPMSVATTAPPQDRPDPRDLSPLHSAGIDAVFLPDRTEFHPGKAQTIVETTEFARILNGKLRPGHFRNLATEVTRLFNIIQPDTAIFGEKDYQALCVIRQLVRDLNVPVRIIGVPTVREADGLAVSSRNTRLTPRDRSAAVVLSRALAQAAEMAKTGITASRLRAWVAAHIQAEPRADLQLADIRDAWALTSLSGPLTAPAVILLAVRFGGVSLIDHRIVTP